MTLADVIRDRMDREAGLGMPGNALAAVRAVLTLHHTMSWFGECGHAEPDDPEAFDAYWATHFRVGEYEDFVSCEDGRMPSRCTECTRDDADDDTSVPYPCPTVLAVCAAFAITPDQVGADT